VKDLLLNVGSGGGAAAVASSGAPAAGGAAAPEEAKEEEKKEEGKYPDLFSVPLPLKLTHSHRKGRVRRGYGIRTFRLSAFRFFLSVLTMHGSVFRPSVQYLLGLAAFIE
jgi:hypothetical protein